MLSNVGLFAQQKEGKIYWISTVTVPLGKIKEYHAFLEKELMPVQEKLGYRYVGGYQTVVGDIEEITAVAEFESMDAYQKARAGLMASTEWITLGQKLDSLIRGIQTKFAIAIPYLKAK
jgi:hypothetical protein